MINWRKILVSSLLVSGVASFMKNDVNAMSRIKLEKPVILAAETINLSQNPLHYKIKGKGLAGANIKVHGSDGKNSVVGQASVKKDGTFEVPVNLSKLKDGKLTFSITQTKNRKSSDIIKKEVLKDTKAPVVPVLESELYINSKNQSAYIVKGKAEPLSKVYVNIRDQKTVFYQTGQADKNGNFTFKLDLHKLQDGQFNIAAVSTDAAGNKSGYSKDKLLIKDTSVVEEPTIISEEYVNSFNVDSYPISGTGTPSEKISVIVKDGSKSVTGIGEVDELGNYSVELDLTPLNEGDLIVEVKQINSAGNESEVAEGQLRKDLLIPSNTIIFNNGYINEDTDSTSYTVVGRGQAGSELEVILSDGVNEVSSLGTVEENGKFSVKADVRPLNDGEITISVIQISPAGNRGETETTTILKDTTAPNSPELNAAESISELNVKSYTISGTGETDATVFITATDGESSLLGKVKVDTSGNFNTNLDVSSLNNGNITFIVLQKDGAGNVSKGKAVMVLKNS